MAGGTVHDASSRERGGCSRSRFIYSATQGDSALFARPVEPTGHFGRRLPGTFARECGALIIRGRMSLLPPPWLGAWGEGAGGSQPTSTSNRSRSRKSVLLPGHPDPVIQVQRQL